MSLTSSITGDSASLWPSSNGTRGRLRRAIQGRRLNRKVCNVGVGWVAQNGTRSESVRQSRRCDAGFVAAFHVCARLLLIACFDDRRPAQVVCWFGAFYACFATADNYYVVVRPLGPPSARFVRARLYLCGRFFGEDNHRSMID
jgi:hypothetical protein